MSEPRWREIERLVLRALELEPEEIDAYLDAECGEDVELRERVERLLESHRLCDPVFLEPEARERPARRLPGEETTLSESAALGKYRVLRKLGEGGMATVYLAEHSELHNEVALKVLPRFATSSEERVARFRREAVTLAKLRHPGIVSVHDVGEDDGLHYLVMDYVEGPTYAQVLLEARARDRDEGGRPSRSRDYVRRQCDWIARVAEALHHAHETGIVHRDVKPSNILLLHGEEPLLTDFGVAKNLLEPSNTETGQLAGTAPYMSPEQVRALKNAIDPRSDVFSLGTLLYEALTLRQPFRGETLEESLQNVLHKEPARLDLVNRSVPRDLATICHKALEKDPQHRYSTAAHMAGDLRSFLAGRPILASPPSLWRRGRELVRRRRVTVLASAAVVLAAALVSLALFTRASIRAGQGRVVIDAGVPGSRILVQRVDVETRDFGPRERLGETPFEGHLDPGHYRFTVLDGGSPPWEASLLLREGADEVVRVERVPQRRASRDMILVEGGLTSTGARLESFYLDRREVSNRDYRRFVEASGHPEPEPWRVLGFPEAQAELPVVAVSFRDCQAYARWAGVRLPSSAEWQHAMTRPDGRRTPWGDAVEVPWVAPTPEESAEVAESELEASFARYLSSCVAVFEDPHPAHLGFLHAAGNVRELTDTTEDLIGVVVRGASWRLDPEERDLHSEGFRPILTRSDEGELRPAWSVELGFRCARSARVEE